jgi:hypothetical protein
MDRIISEDWQDDEYVIALPDAAYRVFDLLVKATNRIGIAKSRHGLMRYRCNQMPPDQYSAIISKLEADGKIAEVSGYTVIMNHYKYWDYSVPNTAKGAIYDIISIIDDVIANPQARTAITNLINKILKQQRDKPSITDILGLVNGKLTVRYGLTISSPHIEIERERENKEKEKTNNIPPISPQPEKSTFTKAEKAEEALMEKKGYGNIADIVGVKDKMYVRIHWIEDIRRRFPKTYKDAVIKALKKQATNGARMQNPEGYIEAILNNAGGKYNGKNK